jgi:hypothetical protein
VQVQVGGFVTDVDSEGVFVMPKLRPLALTAILVRLIPSASGGLVENPILVLKITISDRFTDNAKVESIQSSLEINSKLIRVFGYVSLLVKIGTAISEVSVHSNDDM